MKPNQKLFDILFDASVEIEERVYCSDIEMIGRDNENDENDDEIMKLVQNVGKTGVQQTGM